MNTIARLVLCLMAIVLWACSGADSIGEQSAELASPAMRVNAGANSAFTDSQGQIWSADSSYTGGTVYSNNQTVQNTSDSTLYNTERYSTTGFSYTFPVSNAFYVVTLKFAETLPGITAAGQRKFNVTLNGKQVLSQFDIYAAAGNRRNWAVDREFPVEVTNGQIKIDFAPTSPQVENPKVNAIQIRPLTSLKRINSGATTSYTDTNGLAWAADNAYDVGTTYSNTANVTNRSDDTLYNTERYNGAAFTYTIASLTASAQYAVNLKFAETLPGLGLGQRKFNVAINGAAVLTNFDIYAAAGGPNLATDQLFLANADANGRLVITFSPTSPQVQNPKVNAIEVLGAAVPLACGDGTCAATEYCSTCPVDCGACSTASCSVSLQSLVDAAPAGSVLNLPACVYRQSVVISKALTLSGQPGTEIRGSDVWTGWTASGGKWTSTNTVPNLGSNGNCVGDGRCAWPEQAFFDGQPLYQRPVGATPSAAQFALDGSRHVVLGRDPTGHTVEVTTRARWIDVTASGVTITKLTMRHAGNLPQAQSAALRVGLVNNVTVTHSALWDVHGSLLGVAGGTGITLVDNELARGGQQAYALTGLSSSTFSGNRIHDNQTEDFDTEWEAGAGKITKSTNVTVDGNDVHHNKGPGIWFDTIPSAGPQTNAGAVISNNVVHHNSHPGIVYEVSDSVRISGNKVWENGWGKASWGWGAGILVSSSRNAEVFDNIVAWNADGISVVSQSRSDQPVGGCKGNYVHGNTIALAPQASDTSDKLTLGWMQDWAGILFDPASNNRGAANRYWHSQSEPSYCRFAWNGCKNTLADFNLTAGEEAGTYLSTAQKDSALSAAGIPTSPEPH